MSLARAIETGDLAELPSRRDEDWRWSDLRGLVRSIPERSPADDDHPEAPAPFDGLSATRIDFTNGDSGRIDVATNSNEIWAVTFRSTARAGAHVNRLDVAVGPGGSLVLLEAYTGARPDYVCETDIDIRLGEGCRLERIVVADDGEEAVNVSSSRIDIAPGARLDQTVVTSGARRQRLETRVRHPGGGAKVRLDGLYVIGGRRHGDLTTVVVHEGPGGDTDQVTKGVAIDQGRGVFQGRIEVRPGADRTNARMQHRALVLSDRAEVDAKPELEIYADDVACSHGNSVGALDEEALFYARQRGIPEDAARAMLTKAFLDEVVERIDHEGARDAVRRFVVAQTEKLS
ncbi:MAG TPA: Fe-S cluster assembly protein SufD [Caulobacteraceae bacterium]|jgi:Fe-S cluster assembly protein SufD